MNQPLQHPAHSVRREAVCRRLARAEISFELAFSFLFLAIASHGLLDAMTTGGLAVGFLIPFSKKRFFIPFRPIRVSAIAADRFLENACVVITSEARWVWAPLLALEVLGLALRRLLRSAVIVLPALIASLALGAIGCSTTATPAAIPKRLDALFTDLHQRGLFDGAVVVGRGRDVVWERGFGYANVERQVLFTPETPSDSGSLAKPITAALVIMLAREGLLDLDEPAQRLLPELPYPEITLRHLLSHSSGLPVLDYDYFDPFLPPGQIRTTERLLAVLAEQKPALAFAPGTAFEYSNLGYDFAALAAARAARKPLAELLKERFFVPLGMSSAFLRPGRLSDFPGIRTMGYRRAGGQLQVHDVFDFEGFHGGSNIYISARDLHRWNASFLGRPLLGEAALAQSLELARIGGAPSGLTLGSWYRSSDRAAFSYAGHLQGFHGEVFRNTRSGWSIVYVSNNTIEPWLQHAVVRAVNAIVDGRDSPPLTAPAVDEVRKEERGLIAGRWLMPGGETITIEDSERRLFMTREGVRYPMFQVGPRAFYAPGLDLMIGFARDPDGVPAKIHLSSNFDERWGFRPR